MDQEKFKKAVQLHQIINRFDTFNKFYGEKKEELSTFISISGVTKIPNPSRNIGWEYRHEPTVQIEIPTKYYDELVSILNKIEKEAKAEFEKL